MAQQSEKHNTAAGEEKKKRCFIKSQCSENVCHLSRPLQSERKSDTEGEVFLSKKKKEQICVGQQELPGKKKNGEILRPCVCETKSNLTSERGEPAATYTHKHKEREREQRPSKAHKTICCSTSKKKERQGKKKTSRRVKRRRLRKLHHFPAQGVSSLPYGIRHSL